jgi:hypothetical protein
MRLAVGLCLDNTKNPGLEEEKREKKRLHRGQSVVVLCAHEQRARNVKKEKKGEKRRKKGI